jgi:c-di-GMP-binding flagellar brake protein YcgR
MIFESREQRRYKRFAVDIMDINSRMVFANEVEILDISLGGVSVRVDRRLNIGNEYSLKIEDRARTICLKGVVVWSLLSEMRKSAGGEMAPIYTVGMKFADISKEGAAELADFIEGRRLDHLDKEVHEPSGLRLNIRFNISASGKTVLDYPESYCVKKLSLGGMLVESPREMEVESRFPMEVSLPNNTVVRFQGRVASCLATDEVADRGFDVGIEFADMSKKDRERLRKFIGVLHNEGC